MIRSVIRFNDIARARTFANEAVARFIGAIERALGFEFVIDSRKVPFEEPTLADVFAIAEKLKKSGVMKGVSRTQRPFADEPRLFSWVASYAKGEMAGGSSPTSDRQALIATLAECLERHLWRFESDYYLDSCDATEDDMHPRGGLSLSRFAGFTVEQRNLHPGLRYDAATRFRWIRAESLVSHSPIYVPAQVVSGLHPKNWNTHDEPLIRPRITTGLATGETGEDALLGGVLEVIERDAYMIMWLNQLSPPRIDLDDLAEKDAEFASLLLRVRKYRLQVDIIRLITDAPTHAVCAVVRDESDVPVILGLGVGSRIARASTHAITEALRIRINARGVWKKNIDAAKLTTDDIHHFERAIYWLHGERHKKLTFMTSGPIQKHVDAPWEEDSPKEHLARIIAWCAEKGYECASVDVGRSKKNPTSWAVEMVVIPEMQPLHLVEKVPCIGGERRTEIPKKFGYAPREKPFVDEPHPFV